jgi:hypothetical protein
MKPKAVNHKISKLPKWVQELLQEKDRQIACAEAKLRRTQQIHALTCDGRDWFTLGQCNEMVATLTLPCKLFVTVNNDLVPVASLSKGDCLFVARALQKNKQ